ncbi:ribonuclease [Sphingomonas sp.]|uniref:ribonuclease n=1 Tax=Sphingomonas sp. TaxID=28214 RepID=UPI00286DC233|nr:ribonuclease [Sphingomonas sp.]
MAEWLVERGIGETRAALVEDGAIVEARITLDGTVEAGTVIAAQLIDIGPRGGNSNGRNAIARDAQGQEYLLPTLERGVTEGAALAIEVTREVIPGGEAWKRPRARTTAAAPAPAPPLAATELPFPPHGRDALADAGWDDVVEEARSGHVEFGGGSLTLFATPAMTLIDVDGNLPPAELAVAGAAAAAQAIRRLGLGGSIGIDLPTVAGKAPRLAAAEAVDAILPQPFERTTVNGFGFLQIIRPRPRASLLEIWADRAAAEARALLRRAALSGPGARRLAAHPAVIGQLEANPAWTAALARQIGGAVTLRADLSLAISGGHAEPA